MAAIHGLPGSPERRAYEKRWREANADKTRATHLKRWFGLTLEAYETMHAAQDGVCAICFEPEVGKLLAVDHCHTTDRIRGLLCTQCNTALGKFRDDPARLQSAINYLQKGQPQCAATSTPDDATTSPLPMHPAPLRLQ